MLKAALHTLLASLLYATGAVATETITTNGRDQVRVVVTNSDARPLELRRPAGTIFATEKNQRVVTLKETALSIAPSASAEVEIPAAALSSANLLKAVQPAHPIAETEARLAPLLKFLATQPDLPRATSQCAVLVLTEDITYSQWLTFRTAPATPDEPLLEAVDALSILRSLDLARTARLAQDQELKFKALRHPGTRGKAGQLYGLAIPGDAAPGQAPPDLGQLLHTKPGDNCPICRMRAQMQGAPSNGL